MEFDGFLSVIVTLIVGGVLGGCAGFISGGVVGWLRGASFDARLDSLDARFTRFHNDKFSGPANAVRKEKQERQQEAILKVMGEIQSGKSPQEAIQQASKEYPDVTLDLMHKQLFRGKGPLGKIPKLLDL